MDNDSISTSSKKHKKPKPSQEEEEQQQEDQQEETHTKKNKSKKRKTLKLTLEAVSDRPGRTPPVVGYFPSGFKPGSHGEGSSFDLYRHVRHSNRLEAVVRPAGADVEFVGTSYAGEAAAPQLCTYALGVFDREEKRLKILPVAANKIFRFEPRVKRDEEPAQTEPSEALTEVSATGKSKKRIQDLTSIYGTKMDKTRDKKYQTLFDQHNYDLGEAGEFLKNEDQESEQEVEMGEKPKGSGTFRNIPPFDPSADVAEKVYDLDQIIPSGERPYLMDILEDSYNADKKANYPSFVANRLYKLNKAKGSDREKLACILSYITHLHSIWARYRKPKFDKQKDDNAPLKMPRFTRQRLISLFVDPESGVLSSAKAELLVGHILVLTLFADNFKTDPTDVAKDLMMTPQGIRVYFIQLGCKMERAQRGAKGTWVLKAPVEFVEMRRLPIKRGNIR